LNTGRKGRKSCAKDAKNTKEDLLISFVFSASFAQLLRLLRPAVE
jgi:hypothetical protein